MALDVLALRGFDLRVELVHAALLLRDGFEARCQPALALAVLLGETLDHATALLDLLAELADPRPRLLAIACQPRELLARIDFLAIEHLQARLRPAPRGALAVTRSDRLDDPLTLLAHIHQASTGAVLLACQQSR